jgi:hypothetical protein
MQLSSRANSWHPLSVTPHRLQIEIFEAQQIWAARPTLFVLANRRRREAPGFGGDDVGVGVNFLAWRGLR